MNPGNRRRNHPLNQPVKMPKPEVMRSRLFVGLGLGIAGMLSGAFAVALQLEALAIVAAVCAILGCVVITGLSLSPMIRIREKTSGDLNSRIQAVTSAGIDIDAPVPLGNRAIEESVIDAVTDLPDARFFEVAVDGRVAAARRHLWPVSLVLIQLGFDAGNNTGAERDRSLAGFANLMRQTLREADIACRLSEDTFGLILEDTSEEGGVWTAERLQIALSHDATSIRRLVAGVAAYPTHGLSSKDVLVRAQAALQRASSTPTGHGLGQVEVAHVDLS